MDIQIVYCVMRAIVSNVKEDIICQQVPVWLVRMKAVKSANRIIHLSVYLAIQDTTFITKRATFVLVSSPTVKSVLPTHPAQSVHQATSLIAVIFVLCVRIILMAVGYVLYQAVLTAKEITS